MLEKVSIEQALIDYELEQKAEFFEAQGYYGIVANHFHNNKCAVYEDKIIDLVGTHGLELLRKHNLIECCALINYRKLYAL